MTKIPAYLKLGSIAANLAQVKADLELALTAEETARTAALNAREFAQQATDALQDVGAASLQSSINTLIGRVDGHDTTLSSKADQTAVDSLSSSVATKANTSDIPDISGLVSTKALATKANASDLQTLQDKVPNSLEPTIFDIAFAGIGLYSKPQITQGQYPLHGIDHNHTDALVMPHTAGMSSDWVSEFSNAALDKKVVSNVANSLAYNGSGPVSEHSLVTTKEYTVSDGFNFSCKAQLKGAGFNNVLAYNGVVDETGLSNYNGVTISGPDEVDVVIVKDQDSDNIRVWKDGVEDATVYQAFTGGHLVVLANSNVTFSEVKLTDTTVDLGISSMLKKYKYIRVATIQSANPVTKQNVDVSKKVNETLQNEIKLVDPTKDQSSLGYLYKVGAGTYYQIVAYDDIVVEGQITKRLGNILIASDLAIGGTGDGVTYTASFSNLDPGKTLSLKYYSEDVAYLREQLTVTGIDAPTIKWSDLTTATQTNLITLSKPSFPAGTTNDAIIASLTQGFAGYSLLQVVTNILFDSRPLQSAPEFINMASSAVVSQTNPTGDFTVQNIESYKQLSTKLADFDYNVSGANITVDATYSFTSAESVKAAILTELGSQKIYLHAELIPSQLITNSWLLNTLNKSELESVITDPNSFPTYDEFNLVGLSALADVFVNELDQVSPTGNGLASLNALSYKTFAENVILKKPITINDLNGDYTINVTSLADGDEQKFRQALAMKESTDIETDLNIPVTGVFGYSVVGLLPSQTVAVSWYYVSPIRNADNVWLYTRVFDLKTMSYVDADVRREGSVNIIYEPADLAQVPQAVKDKYISAYSIDLDSAGTVNSTNKILWNYTGDGGQEYYNYSDVSDPQNQINKVLISNDGLTWLTDVEAFTGGWIFSGQMPPNIDLLKNDYVDTWTNVQNRLNILASPSSYPVNDGLTDFTTFVAIGNSLTSGYTDNALFADAQTLSFAQQLANKMNTSFNTPTMDAGDGGLLWDGNKYLDPRFIYDETTGLPIVSNVAPTTEVSNIKSGPFNNLGVPGAKSYHLIAPGYGNLSNLALGLANPYFVRMASTPNATIVGDALSQNPTFFTLYIGSNDVLGYAASGGTGTDQTGNQDPTTYGPDDITDPRLVLLIIYNIVSSLASSGAKGVIFNIVDILKFPYFTHISHNPLPLDETNAAQLNTLYSSYNNHLGQAVTDGTITEEEKNKRTINFVSGLNNALVITDNSLTDLTSTNPAFIKMRQATSTDLILLPNSSKIGQQVPTDSTKLYGLSEPLPDSDVLTPEEQEKVNVAINTINTDIRSIATTYGLAFVDAYTEIENLNGTTLSDGTELTMDYPTGGLVSLDGIHPTPRGYALLANLAIDAINTTYSQTLVPIDVNNVDNFY